jgi:UDP-N-acetyl-2-amino-2-deoxyglucuronate dehydrogenase
MDQLSPSAQEPPPSRPRPVRLGLVGCGYQGGLLATAIALSPMVDLVACADTDVAAASRVAALCEDVKAYPSVGSLLDEAIIDAVVVATPNHVLCPLSLAAIRAGKHVFVEKPMAMAEGEAAEIEQEAARVGAHVMVGYSCRFSLARQVKDLLRAGLAGDIQAISGTFAATPMEQGWLSSVETGGGALLHLGSHLVDMLLWFANDQPVEISSTVRRRPGTGVDDTSAFQILFAQGAVAQCLVTQSASTFYFTVDIHGSAGRVALRGWGWLHYEIEVTSRADPAYDQPTVIRPVWYGDHITAMLVPEVEEFARAVTEDRAPAITASDGRQVLRVLDAVVESDRLGAPVRADGPTK